MTSKRLGRYLEDYRGYHRTAGNEICHAIGIPLIVVSTLGALSAIALGLPALGGSPLLRIDAGTLFWAVASIGYVILEWRLGIPFSFVILAAYFIGRTLPTPALGTMFVAGWIFQGIGHAVYEKKSPAFFRNAVHLFIGPLWIFIRLTQPRSLGGGDWPPEIEVSRDLIP